MRNEPTAGQAVRVMAAACRPRPRARAVLVALTLLTALAGRTAGAADHRMNGVWQIDTAVTQLTEDGAEPPLKAGARSLYLRHQIERAHGDAQFDPAARCLPPGLTRLLTQPLPFRILVGSRLTLFLFASNRLNREVSTTGERFEAVGPLYLGQSFGTWRGRELQVQVGDFNDATLLDDAGMPHSDRLSLTERYRLTAPDRLEDRIRIEDPQTFSRAWSTTLRFHRLPEQRINEDYCLGRLGLVTDR